jgi:HlyD family secretion protein
VTRKRWWILVVVLVVMATAGGGAFWMRREVLREITVETLRTRDLEAVVSASGKIQPKRQVNVSANTMGRVTRLSVEEGQRVRTGQFLLEIDPRSLEGQLQRGEASVAAARSSLQQSRSNVEQARTNVEQARATLDLARQNLKRQEDLWKDGLTTRESLERAQSEVAVRQTDLKAREQEVQTRVQEVQTREEQIKQEQAGLATTRYNLSQVIISSPMDGIVTRRNIEQGENVMVGTMNNAGTVLLTIADMSVIEAEVEVDETDIPTVTLGQEAKVTIDAVPDRTFRGRVTEIGNSPIQQTGTQANAQQQATNFKVVITLEEEVPDVRPGFTCTARDHNRHSQERRIRTDPSSRRPRDAVRRHKQPGARATASAASALLSATNRRASSHTSTGAAPWTDAEGNGRRVRAARRACGVRAREGGDCRRAVLRSAQRREG